MNGHCDGCPHLYYEDPEFKDGPVVWKCDCNRCVKDKDRKKEE